MSVESEAPEQTEEVTPNVEPENTVISAAPESIDLSKHFAELKRKDRELQAERVRMKQAAEAEKQQWLQEFRSSPAAKLQELGLSKDELASRLLELPEEDPTSAHDKELAELKSWKDQQVKQAEEAKNNQLIADFKKQVFSVVESNVDNYELILNVPGGKDLFYDSVISYYQEYEALPDMAELANTVETQLFEQNKALLGLKKFKPKEVTPPVQTTPEKPQDSADSNANSFKTLSNRMSAHAGPTVKLVNQETRVQMHSPYNQALETRKEQLLSKYLKGK